MLWSAASWCPQLGRELCDVPCIKNYLNHPRNTAVEDLRTEIYVPLQGRSLTEGARKMKRAARIVVCLMPLTVPSWAQNTAPTEPDRFQELHFLLGAWEGEGQGRPGKSQVSREYALVLDGRFIEVRNRSFYPPQEGNPGEDHRDVGFISFDSARGKHVLRQFHVEGFVNQYVHESTSEDDKTLVFVTEAIENIPAGFRARETYILVGEDELVERFELAEPGKDFELYSETRLRRVSRQAPSGFERQGVKESSSYRP